MIFDIVIISLYDREKQIYSISSTKNVAFSELFRRDKKIKGWINVQLG